ncbi:nuclear receptor subfamily 4 group A member 3 isoform X1 [Tachysurus ichikawai]
MDVFVHLAYIYAQDQKRLCVHEYARVYTVVTDVLSFFSSFPQQTPVRKSACSRALSPGSRIRAPSRELLQRRTPAARHLRPPNPARFSEQKVNQVARA